MPKGKKMRDHLKALSKSRGAILAYGRAANGRASTRPMHNVLRRFALKRFAA